MRVYVRNLGGTPIIIDPVLLPLSQADLDALVAALIADGAIREKLSADRTYFVRTDGSDSNDGLTNSAGGAFLTPQKAIDTFLKLDLGGFAGTIQLVNTSSPSTFTSGILLQSPFIGGNVTVLGDAGTPSNVVISTTGTCVSVQNAPSTLFLSGLKLTSSASSCLNPSRGGTIITTGNMDFGAATAGRHIFLEQGLSKFVALAGYTISGGATDHIRCVQQSHAQTNTITITLTGTPNFSGAYITTIGACEVDVIAATFVGAATGKRYDATILAAIRVNGAGVNYLPGNAAGTVATGAVYA